ncbi:MAG: zinc ribbon domain-containing protein [Dehalococcoidia bacterium]|nr:zinc ribbon domain-containing protein [Dehalococcoidia bacterium]MSQ16730.1 zinc ribbon domain-containing protein [Dehalococcoidia bacterium]
MPLYEYRCDDCQQISTALVYSWSSAATPNCRRCGGARLSRLLSKFAFHRSWGDSLCWTPSGETLGDVNEDDAHSVDQQMGRIKQEMGGQVTPDFEHMRRELFTGPQSFDPPPSADHGHDHSHSDDHTGA